jgi:thiol-disulfide isomerase/thioredoxin
MDQILSNPMVNDLVNKFNALPNLHKLAIMFVAIFIINSIFFKCVCKKKESFAATEKKIIITNYNTTWCGYSNMFTPIWEEFTKVVAADKSLADIVEVVDMKCDEKFGNEAKCRAAPITGFPSVVLENNGKPAILYKGSRTVEDLMEFLKANL